jgi:virginiamycin B lyase
MAGPLWMSVGQEDLWVSSIDTPKIMRVTPAGTTRDYPTDTVIPFCLTVGPDGNIWFASRRNVGRMTPEGMITSFPLPPVELGSLATIVSGPDGNLWYGDYMGQRIGRMTTDGILTEFQTSNYPWAMAAGGGGNLWFVDPPGNVVGRVTPEGNITVLPLAGDATLPVFITAGPDGNVWVTVHARQNRPPVGKIVRVSATGAITEFLLPEGSTPVGITAGPDCNLWFTEAEARLGRISPMGTIAEFPLPAGTVPQSIVTGSDGNLWFTEPSGRIGRFVPP